MIHLTKIIAAVLVLLAIALGGYAWVLSRTPAKPPPVAEALATTSTAKTPSAPVYAVVIAVKPIAAGQPITAEALRVEQLPINPTGAFKEIAPLLGRVPVFDLGEGTPLLEGQLASGLAMRVEEGERAVAIKADEVMGVGNKVQPGDFVDVFVMLKFDGKDVDRSQARLLLSRKRVLAFGNSSVDALPSKTADGNGNPAAAQQQRNDAARTAVLAVPVEDINRLTLGESTGRLLLALRNPLDTNLPDPSLLAVLPVALPPPPLKRGEQPRGPLEGLDSAQAGLTAADLVTGGTAAGRRQSEPRIYAAPASLPRQAGSGARPGLEVEMIRGDRSETLRY
ncbi:Flp pilus assembly protein CpaB [Variovorax boronicumulans]|uniref:Flp pilus assembly protein CpaB n=1 Tax=Variovorax boronicumulans TaxID=436515 RepID=UPI0012E5DB1C|nr:Flp pilus assembly protein CpaB [Variovorax boronicumulans]GER14335.1 Flp pilus assembly protein CpaB [Variovorax boronicumulans]